ncbi:hypothetical protein DC366_04980 [Pelagivirga sediminicola]|uniref:Alpha-1,2-fucosyltransferase n=1 Tax=Pelagivirga sediminicola TaxID=2170575 RepID=A0A2T7G9Q7_9RHOB|nr:alpha-1,2-fucosyltransferase [Pelagivirga sediminicola]PVA11118.1 hypothetical protein DC366_04980 [Pelagivirga sediminicola]
MTTFHRNLLKALNRVLADKNLAVIRNEGGLASQIAFWALGYEFAQLGYKVKFDNSWFKASGLDINGLFPRNFDFPKAFPSLSIDEASVFERFILKKLNNFREGDLNDVTAPVYLGGFYDRWKLVQKHREHLYENFSPDSVYFSEKDIEILAQIKRDENSCGVHVRRGDLASDHPDYGKSLQADYFLRAIDEIRTRRKDPCFYFFSDEPEWIKSNIVENLGPEIRHVVVDSNGSDRGFIDLYLMSRCHSFISSQGAYGKYARILGDPSRLIIEPSSQALFDKDDANVIVLEV